MDVLDEIKRKQNKKSTYSKLSLFVGCITIFLFAKMFLQLPTTLKATEGFAPISVYLINGVRVSSIAGIIFSLLSFMNKEPSGFVKWTGATINVLCFLVIFGSILFAIIIKMNQ